LRETVEVVAFETLAEAAARLDETWDGFILDHGLPDGDGLTFAKQILARRPGASIVLFTTADPDEVMHEASVSGILYAHKVDGISLLKRVVAGWARGDTPDVGSLTPPRPRDA
jgi:DNA-binding NarL/FixJ family response regulator